MAFADQWLNRLIPTEGLWGWYPVNDTTDLISSSGVLDESGNNRDLLSTGTPAQTYEADGLAGRSVVKHLGTEFPLVAAGGGVVFKHMFMVVRSTESAAFGAYRGLITAQTSTAILIGDTGTSKFVNVGFAGNWAYFKSQVTYTESNQQAPFTKFELVEVSRPTTGFSLTDLQVGQDRADTGRRFIGKWAELITFTSAQTGDNLTKLRLYFDLKFGLWALNGTTLIFPNPDLLNINGAAYYSRRLKTPKDWDAITYSHEYEDAGRDFNEVNTAAPIRWELLMLGIDPEDADVYDAFNDQARRANTFTFTDKGGTVYTDVQIESYSRDHAEHLSQYVDVRFVLVKYP